MVAKRDTKRGDERHPRDRFITVAGRNAVLEALANPSLRVHVVHLDQRAHADTERQILAAATTRGVRIDRCTSAHLTKLARNRTQHQGVVADVDAPRMQQLSDWLDDPERPISTDAWVLVFSRVTNPANVGITIRSAVAAAANGIVLPREHCPDLDPAVVTASAGVAFHAPILRCPSDIDALTQLREHHFTLIGMDTGGGSRSLYDAIPEGRIAVIVGAETTGISESVGAFLDEKRAIPMDERVESLNVSAAASIALFEIARQRNAQANR